MGDTISEVEYHTSDTTGSVQGQYVLDGVNITGELKVSKMISVELRVEWGFGQEHWMLFWRYIEFILESVMPDFLHVLPVGDVAVFNRIFNS